MQRLSLDEAWTLCMKMWRWIAKEKRTGSKIPANTLKYRWLKRQGITSTEWPAHGCYFCEYDEQHSRGGIREGYATDCCCPGNRIDKKFRCDRPDYHFYYKPLVFYAKLRELHKKYKAKKAQGGGQQESADD